MNRKLLKKVKFVSIICVFILIVEIIYVSYCVLYKNTESLYFDGINAIDYNDNYYVTVGSNNNNDNYYEKAKLSIYNNKREKKYEKLYNIGYNSAFFGVLLDNDYIVCVGSYEKTSSEHDDQVRRGLIVKYNLNGDIEFEEDFQLLDNTKFTSINVVDDGYLVTGQSVYKSTRIGSDSGGAIILKYDLDGNLLWSKTYGNSKSSIFNDLLVVDNYYYAVGSLENYVGVVCKYDFDGNLVTYNDYKYIDDIGFSGIVNISDKLYISGANRHSDSNTDAMIVEYDLDCTYIKEKVYSTKGLVRYNKLQVDNHNNIIAIGIIANPMKSNEKTADNFNYDGIVGKYNSNLDEVDVVTYGDERDDYFTDIKIVNGEYLIVGYSSYEDGSYLSKFIRYSSALKVLGVE
jgi:hypothetical protein